jgi:hypothetical protein
MRYPQDTSVTFMIPASILTSIEISTRETPSMSQRDLPNIHTSVSFYVHTRLKTRLGWLLHNLARVMKNRQGSVDFFFLPLVLSSDGSRLSVPEVHLHTTEKLKKHDVGNREWTCVCGEIQKCDAAHAVDEKSSWRIMGVFFPLFMENVPTPGAIKSYSTIMTKKGKEYSQSRSGRSVTKPWYFFVKNKIDSDVVETRHFSQTENLALHFLHQKQSKVDPEVEWSLMIL